MDRRPDRVLDKGRDVQSPEIVLDYYFVEDESETVLYLMVKHRDSRTSGTHREPSTLQLKGDA